MKTLKILKTETYANPNPALEHTSVVKDEVVELEDRLADSIIDCGGAELSDDEIPAVDDSESESDDASDSDDVETQSPAELMAEANTKKDLKGVCKAKALDQKGSKVVLAQRLIDAGVAQI